MMLITQSRFRLIRGNGPLQEGEAKIGDGKEISAAARRPEHLQST